MFNITDYFNVYVCLMFNFIVLNQKEIFEKYTRICVNTSLLFPLSWKFPQLNLTAPLVIRTTNQNKRLEISVLFVSIAVEQVEGVTD